MLVNKFVEVIRLPFSRKHYIFIVIIVIIVTVIIIKYDPF